ncbi:MAG: alpha/beta hydrolase-fold protein [Deltaproteobacteria bacterium]|nr:alpha/beta hydrolase-fold protein [Deltaproteobacteria bacterium]
MVFLPGFLDRAETFVDRGFPQALFREEIPCDVVALDLHIRYYTSLDVGDLVYEEVIDPALGRGYGEIWMVGISMGGLGALWTGAKHGSNLAGIVLIAPFLGEERVLKRIEAKGGARMWTEREKWLKAEWSPENYTEKIWAWLGSLGEEPMVFAGWGKDDARGKGGKLLRELLPEGHLFIEEGGHNWQTWKPIWIKMLGRIPFGRLGRASLNVLALRSTP